MTQINITLISLLIFIISLYGLTFVKLKNKAKITISAVSFLTLLFYGLFYLANDFTGAGIDESVIYHLFVGVTGAGLSDYILKLLGSFLYLLIAITISFAIFRLIGNGNISKKSTILFLFFILGISTLISPVPYAIYNQHTNFSKPLLSENYIQGTGTKNIRNKKNIVFLYLEGVERTFLDESLFPGLMPNLRRFENQALSFTDITQVYGTGWTIAGMVASQCGVSLGNMGNQMEAFNQFLPSVNCIGDELSKFNYELNYLGGADLNFAGKGNFYRTHGFNRVEGFQELKINLKDKSYRSAWGLYDDSMYKLLQDRFDELSARDKPFFLAALTLDTHPPKGQISEFCKEVKYRDGQNPMLNAVHCADMMASKFIKHIVDSPYFFNTTLVVMSDHLSLKNSASDILKKGTRRNLVMIFDKDIQAKKINRQGSMLDIGPTILSIIGWDGTGLGFGRSLFGNERTLVENFSNFTSNFLKNQSLVLKEKWNGFGLDSGLTIFPDDGYITSGNRRINLPLLLKINNNQVIDIKNSINSPIKLETHVMHLSDSQQFIWIDRCNKIKRVFNIIQNISLESYCFSIGDLSRGVVLKEIDKSKESIKAKYILDIINNSQNPEYFLINKKHKLALVQKFGTTNMNYIKLPSEPNHGILLLSKGGISAGNSEVKLLKSSHKTKLVRGLTLFGIADDYQFDNLGHVDTCGPSNPLKDKKELIGNFSKSIEKYKVKYKFFIIISHDSVICEPYDLASLFANLPLDQWKKIRTRYPYIAVLGPAGFHTEYVGSYEDTIGLQISGHPLAKQSLLNKNSIFQIFNESLSKINSVRLHN